MKKLKLLTTAMITLLAFGVPAGLNAADAAKADKKAAKDAPAAPAKEGAKADDAKPLPFHGTVGSVDKTAKTITVTRKKGDTVYTVTADTKITKKDAPATLDDVTPQSYITGSYVKSGDKQVLHSVKLGEAKPDKSEKKADAKPADKAPAKTK